MLVRGLAGAHVAALAPLPGISAAAEGAADAAAALPGAKVRTLSVGQLQEQLTARRAAVASHGGALPPSVLAGWVGAYSPAQRRMRLRRWFRDRLARAWVKKVNYECRHTLANNRVRIKGRFVKKVEGADGPDVAVASTAAASASTASLSDAGERAASPAEPRASARWPTWAPPGRATSSGDAGVWEGGSASADVAGESDVDDVVLEDDDEGGLPA
jgi:hypothetical protein